MSLTSESEVPKQVSHKEREHDEGGRGRLFPCRRALDGKPQAAAVDLASGCE